MTKRANDMTNWREKEFLSINDITAILGVGRENAMKVLYQMPFVRVGKLYRVSTRAFEKWIRDQERRRANA